MVFEKRIGNQLVRRESQDECYIEMSGDVTADEMIGIYGVHDELLLENGYLLVLVDVAKSTGMSRDAQRASKKRPKKLPAHAVAVIGAPFVIRVFIDLIARATSVLSKTQVTLRFFDGAASAQEWLASMRPKLQNKRLESI